MEGLSTLLEWFVANEAALSGVAATVVILGFVASPLGAGLRGLVRRRADARPEDAATLAEDIPTPPDPETDRPSVAVLPFASATDDKDSEMFADGMTDDIITALGHVPGFFVTSGNSTFAYKGKSIDTRQIGRELDVRYVVEGRVRRAANDVRINATLVEARTGNQIWSEQFNGDLSDVFSLQDEIARSIVGQLQPELMQAEWRRGSRTPTENLDAWTLLHSARMKYQIGHSRDSSERAIRLAEAALEKDPDYADVHAFLTWILLERVSIRWSVNLEQDNERAAKHCRKALELDPENPLVLLCAAVLNMFGGQPETAMDQIEQSCAINPNDAFAQAQRGWMLVCAGRGEQCLKAVDLALRLSPRDPGMYWLLNVKAFVLISLEQYGEAEPIVRRSLGLNDGFFWAWLVYALILAMQGKNGEATDAVQELKRVAPDFDQDDLQGIFRTWQGNPSGERGAIIDRQINALREVWPSSDEAAS